MNFELAIKEIRQEREKKRNLIDRIRIIFVILKKQKNKVNYVK